MSKTVDSRVVEMQFDNSQFERNVSTTMSTLDKLKRSLKFGDSSKGLDNLSKAAKNVDMNGLGNAVENVRMRFSALEVMGVTALANITNSAVNAGKRIVSALTIDPVKSGLNEYETKMGSIQTILANTEHQGTTMDDVTAALDKLNLYADKTIYNFQEMTRNIGTFTAAGVDLETSVKSIQGIANLAAVSGSTSQQASTAMYQLSQALSTGTVRLQDWNSVVNAGMGGKVFQNALIRTAAMLDGAANDVEAWQKKNVDSFGSFRDSLTQGAWLTTDVLTKTLEQFTMAAEEGSEEWNNFKKELMDMGYAEAQAEEILKMANTATDAATKVKTFTQLFDTLKESAQSGWAQTWELIFGDFEEAKEFFTGLSDSIGGFINIMSEWRNGIVGSAFDSNWDKLVDKLGKAEIKTSEYEEKIREVMKTHGETDDSIDELISNYGSLVKAIKAGAVSTDILKEALSKLGISSSESSEGIAGFVEGLEKIERILGFGSVGEDVKNLQTALEKLGYSVGECSIDGIIGPDTTKAIKEFQEAAGLAVDGIAGPDTLAALKTAGKKIDDLGESVDNVDVSYNDLIDNITEKGGRELFLEGFTNAIGALLDIFKIFGNAWSNIFPAENIQAKLFRAIEGFNKFAASLRLFTEVTDDAGNASTKLTDTGEKILKTFEGLLAVVDIVTTVFGGPLKFAINVFASILESAGLSILDVTSSIGEVLVNLRDKVDSVIGTITDFIVENVGKWIEEFKETEFFKTVSGWISDASDTISEKIGDISEAFENFSTSSIAQKLESFAGSISSIAGKLRENKIVGTIVDGVCSAFAKAKEFFSGFKLPEFNLDNLTNFFQNFVKIGEKVEASEGNGIFGLISGFGAHLKDSVISWDWTIFKETALEKFVNFWLKSGDLVKKAFEKGKEVALSIKEFIFGTDDVTLSSILDLAEKFLGILVLIKTLKLLDTLASPFDNITVALENLAGSLKWKSIGEAFKGLALALASLTVCILVLSSIKDTNKALAAAGILAGLMVVMGGVITAIAFFTSKMNGGLDIISASASLLMISGAILLMVTALKQIDELNLNNTGKTFGTLALILLALTAGIKMISKAAGSSFRSVAAILTLMVALKMILDVLDAYDKYDWDGKRKAINKMTQMLLMLSLAINIASRGVKQNASASGLAFLLLAMVISLRLLLDVMKEFAAMSDGDLKRGGIVVAALLGTMTLMLTAINLTSKGTVLNKGQRSIKNFTGLAMALLAMVGTIYLLGKMPVETLKQGGIAAAAIMAFFTILITAVAKANAGLEAGTKAVNHFAGLAMALVAIVGVIWLLGRMPVDELKQGGLAVAGIMLLLIGLVSAIGKSCNGIKTGTLIVTFLSIAFLVSALAVILYAIRNLDPDASVKHMVALGGLLLAMSVAMRSIRNTNGVKAGELVKWVGVMVALGGILYGLTYVIERLKEVDPASSIGNAVALGVLLNAMSSALWIMSNSKSIGRKQLATVVLSMTALGAILYGLTYVIERLTEVDPISAIGNVTALGILLNAMSAALVIMSNSKSMDWKQMGTVLISMGVLTLVLLALTGVLHLMKNIDPINAIGQVTALSILLNAMSSALVIMSSSKSMDWKQMGTVLISMGALSAILYLLVGVIHLMKNIDPISAIGQVAALSILLNAMSSALVIMSYAKDVSADALIGMFGLTAVMYFLVPVVEKLQGLKLPIGNAISLSILLNAMAVAMNILGEAKNVSAGALVGMAAMTIVVAGVAVILAKLAEMNCTFAVSTVISLSIMLIAMSAVYVILGATGGMAGTAVAGATGMIEVIGIIGAVAIAIGGLMSLIPAETLEAWKNGLRNFLDFLVILAEGLGQIVSGFVVGFTDGLAEAGENLKLFADSLSEIKPETITGVQALCDAINALTTANLKDALVNLLPGDNSLSSFGENIKAFANCIVEAADVLSVITDEDVSNIKRSAAAGTALAELNAAIPRQGGWAQTVLGTKDLATFGDSIVAFGACLVRYSATVSGQNIDAEAIKTSAEAGTALSDLSNSIPRQGGWAQVVLGSKELGTFGESIVAFAKCLVDYSAIITGQPIDSEAILRSAEAADSLSALNDKLPKQDGLWQEIAGEKDLTTFGNSLVAFAKGLLEYSNVAVQIDDEKIAAITNSGTAVDELIKVMDKVPEDGGWGDAIFGSKDGQSFGAALSSVASGIMSYCDVASTIDEDDINAIINSKTAITELGTVLETIPENSYYDRTSIFALAVGDISSIAKTINSISDAGYDYTGIYALKAAILYLATGINDIDSDGIVEKYANLKTAIMDAITCAEQMFMLTTYSYSGIESFKEALNNLAGADIDGVISTFSGKSEEMVSAISSLISSITDGVSSSTDDVVSVMESMVGEVVVAIRSKETEYESAGKKLITSVKNGLQKDVGLKDAGKSAAGKAVDGAETQEDDMESAGKDLGSGLVRGINAKQTAAYNAGYALGRKAVQGEKDGQKSNSPSKLTIQAGKWLGEGLVIGIKQMGNKVYSAGSNLGSDATKSISNAISNIANFVDSDIDVNPTIRPVLDLSDVKSGASSISSLLGAGSSISLMSDVKSIGSVMNRRSQNGVNDDVISAIDKLRKDVGNISTPSYNIGGITYDDGSNVSEAIKTLIRVAKIERRV